jgi:predicted ABC-type ATPase
MAITQENPMSIPTFTLFIVRGVPGSGKTSLAHILGANCVAADDYFTDEYGEYKWDPDSLPMAHAWCQDRVAEWMHLGVNRIAVHNTFSRNWEMLAYFEMAEKHGYNVFVIHCENEFGSTHGVPQSAIDKMRSRWEPRAAPGEGEG